jgi:hypothetical protein
MRSRVSFLFLVVLLASACGSASGSRPSNISEPDIDAGLAGNVFFGSGTTAPANIDVAVTNTANVPITLRRVEVDSPGMASYGLIRSSREFRENLAPGETKRVTVFATAVTTVRNPSEPLTIRVIADFESGKDRWRVVGFR